MQLTLNNKTIDQEAIELLQAYRTDIPFYGGFSGGIDSQIIYSLAERAKTPVEWHYNESPIDPTITRNFIKENYPEVIFTNYSQGFWNYEFMANGMPLRTQRWCCRCIKECGGVGRVKLLGMRKEESNKRSCYTEYSDASFQGKNTTWLLPIVNWTELDRKQYVEEFNLKTNPIYSLGFKRSGCILCPNQTKTDVELSLKYFPKIVNIYKLYCDKYIKMRWELWNEFGGKDKRRKKPTYKTGEEYFNWAIQR